MHCWLRSYTEAKLDQQKSTQQYAEAAKKLFQPKNKSKPPTDVNNAEVATPLQPTTQDTESSTTFTSYSTALSSSSATALSLSSSEAGDQPIPPSLISITTRRS
jgi:hypothetical protein